MSVKLIIQISCLNESQHLPVAVAALPRSLPGVDIIETLIVDDGSTDGTSQIAQELGINHIFRHNQNKGLLNSVNRGMLEALRLGS
jgi:glycosyltransferase involved in cell wall biosynthesis